MRVQVSPQRVELIDGQPITVTITVTNTAEVIGGYHLRVLGADPSWVILEAENLSLFPDTTQTVRALINIPQGIGAGGRRLAIQVRELTPPRSISITEVDLLVPAHEALTMRLEPMTVVAGKRGSFGVVLANTGNTSVAVRPIGIDDENKMGFQFVPAVISLAPGDHAIADLRATAPRRWFGSPVVRPFGLAVAPVDPDHVIVEDDTAVAEPVRPKPQAVIEPLALGTFLQKPRLGRGALALLGLIVAVTVFAAVITIALSKLVGASVADRNLAIQVAAARDAGTGGGGSSALGGTVTSLTTNKPAGGVAVEIFQVNQVGSPLASTATADDGSWKLPGLSAGKYQLRFRGAGFAEVWFPAALTAADAQPIELKSGQQRTDLAVVLGGLPATITGQVIGTDPAGAILTVQVPADQLPTDAGTLPPGITGTVPGGTVTSVPISSSGLFTINDLASPAVYDLVVSKPGFASDTQRVDLAGGENRSGISLRLRTGDGSITGTITGPDGPLGEAVITATSGQNTIRTVSLTNQQVGQFILRGLVTPATYTVTVTLDGFSTASSSLTLGAGQALQGVQLGLAKASGSLSGQVTTLAAGAPAPGVTVTVTAGEKTISTVTQSAGNVGSWTVAGLPIPSTYTVTFSRADLQSQTVAVSLDAAGNPSSGGALTVGMQSAFAIIHGTVTQQSTSGGGRAVGEASVTLASATDTYLVTTASTPASALGRFEIRGVTPGTYTLSVARKGTRATSVIITVTAGQVLEFNPVLIQPATLSGTVTDRAAGVAAGVKVTLYQASQYPSTVYQTTTTDLNGFYSFADLDAPQAYVVEVSTPATGALVSSTFSLGASEAGLVNLVFGVAPIGQPTPAVPGGP